MIVDVCVRARVRLCLLDIVKLLTSFINQSVTLLLFQGPNFYGPDLGQAVSPQGWFRHNEKKPRNEDYSTAGKAASQISVLTSSISSLFSLVVDEVGANEKAKEISTTKKMPILIRNQHKQLTVGFLCCFFFILL